MPVKFWSFLSYLIPTVNSGENRVLKELKCEFIKSLDPIMDFFSRERDMIHIRLWFYTVIFPELKSRIFWKIRLRERSLMTSHNRVGRGVQERPKKGTL